MPDRFAMLVPITTPTLLAGALAARNESGSPILLTENCR